MSKIPNGATVQLNTRNTKEAALLYALEEVRPCRALDGNPYAFRVKDGDGEVCWFVFESGPLTDRIHDAFNSPDYIQKNLGAIPDEHMPQVLALVLQMWHNWERLKEATKGLPLHVIRRDGGKITIAGAKR